MKGDLTVKCKHKQTKMILDSIETVVTQQGPRPNWPVVWPFIEFNLNKIENYMIKVQRTPNILSEHANYSTLYRANSSKERLKRFILKLIRQRTIKIFKIVEHGERSEWYRTPVWWTENYGPSKLCKTFYISLINISIQYTIFFIYFENKIYWSSKWNRVERNDRNTFLEIVWSWFWPVTWRFLV